MASFVPFGQTWFRELSVTFLWQWEAWPFLSLNLPTKGGSDFIYLLLYSIYGKEGSILGQTSLWFIVLVLEILFHLYDFVVVKGCERLQNYVLGARDIPGTGSASHGGMMPFTFISLPFPDPTRLAFWNEPTLSLPFLRQLLRMGGFPMMSNQNV